MSKDTAKADTKTTVAAAPAATATATATATASNQGRAVVMKDPKNGGAEIRRVDYIKREFAAGRKRGEIAKELGVPYQIVFAATKQPKPAETTAPAAA